MQIRLFLAGEHTDTHTHTSTETAESLKMLAKTNTEQHFQFLLLWFLGAFPIYHLTL